MEVEGGERIIRRGRAARGVPRACELSTERMEDLPSRSSSTSRLFLKAASSLATPSNLNSACTRVTASEMKSCCSRSLAKLISSCSKPLTSKCSMPKMSSSPTKRRVLASAASAPAAAAVAAVAASAALATSTSREKRCWYTALASASRASAACSHELRSSRSSPPAARVNVSNASCSASHSSPHASAAAVDASKLRSPSPGSIIAGSSPPERAPRRTTGGAGTGVSADGRMGFRRALRTR